MSSSRSPARAYRVWFVGKGSATSDLQDRTLGASRDLVRALDERGVHAWIETNINGRVVTVAPTWQEEP